MTDAAVPVTQSAVEEFTERYLRSIGSQIEIQGNKWEVKIPEDAETGLPTGNLSLICDTVEESDGNSTQLHPESSFFQEVLKDAASRAPLGSVTINASNTDIIVPDWLYESEISVSNIEFSPYYDRRALAVLFQVGIETVSEYQREFLRGIVVDTRSKEILPKLDRTFLNLTNPSNPTITSHEIETEPEQIEQLVDSCRDPLVEDIQTEVDDIHREASRAADAELEEYRQLQQQHEKELAERLSRLQSQIEELNATINESDQRKRVESLKERRECKSEFEEIESELTKLRQRREQGYPQKQREIRDRHALEVVVTPITVTEIKYERGDIEFELVGADASKTITVAYGSGVGVTDEIYCELCTNTLSAERPLGSLQGGLRCVDCV
ncbi:hypothetical protein Z052_00895 [Halorubrum sp. C191]|uniref:hypothetical protein n=1 Tax=Halorubrum sp. C191 TaxID=1383842 RepID=UPI000C06D6DB|nr:hypothetical protein [Halorubrum sp. C191]PHQ44023.1 hypothetical protein Z052_00895 [Halorubrum sp. C191]